METFYQELSQRQSHLNTPRSANSPKIFPKLRSFNLRIHSTHAILYRGHYSFLHSYIQSHSDLELDFCIKYPPKLKLQACHVLKVIKTLYEILDSGIRWHLTFMAHYLDTFQIKRPATDPFVLLLRLTDVLYILILLQVDDSLGLATKISLSQGKARTNIFQVKTLHYNYKNNHLIQRNPHQGHSPKPYFYPEFQQEIPSRIRHIPEVIL